MPDNVISFEPINEIQRQFVTCTKRYACWDGGVWTGKSAGGVMRAAALSLIFPGNRGAIFRYVEEDLERTTRKTFREIIPPVLYDPKAGGKDIQGYTRFINGSEVLWMHLKDLNLKALMSLEIGWFFIDQAEECEASAYEMLETRLRFRPKEYRKGGEKEKDYFPQYGFIDCNPNGKDWIYYKFHPDVCADPANYAYFFTTTADNGEALKDQNPEYYKALQSKPDSWKRRFFYGSREVSEGAWHRGFSPKVHVYDPKTFNPFKERKIVSVYAFFDYGLSAETCCEWVAFDSSGYRWFFKEYYGVKDTIRRNSEELRGLEQSVPATVVGRFADPSIFFATKRDSEIAAISQNQSVADEYAFNGIFFIRADNSEQTAWERIEEGLKVDATAIHPVTGIKGSPKWFFSADCPQAIKQIGDQRRRLKRNPITGESEFTEERDPNVEDHAYDCVRYCGNFNTLSIANYRGPMARPASRYINA